MQFYTIFTDGNDLFTVCYPEDEMDGKPTDIFSKLFELWSDSEYLLDFFIENRNDLALPFWKGMSIDEAVRQVMKEREEFEFLLWAIDTKQRGYERRSFKDLFIKLHENIYSINFDNEDHRKARPESFKSMLRIYALELTDGTYIVTGGAIKLTKKMTGGRFANELSKLKRVQHYLKQEGIINKNGLLENR